MNENKLDSLPLPANESSTKITPKTTEKLSLIDKMPRLHSITINCSPLRFMFLVLLPHFTIFTFKTEIYSVCVAGVLVSICVSMNTEANRKRRQTDVFGISVSKSSALNSSLWTSPGCLHLNKASVSLLWKYIWVGIILTLSLLMFCFITTPTLGCRANLPS